MWKHLVLAAFLAFVFVPSADAPRRGTSWGISPTDPAGWKTWTRRGTVPIAGGECTTDRCLETRERILIEKLTRRKKEVSRETHAGTVEVQ